MLVTSHCRGQGTKLPLYSADTVILEYNNTTKIVFSNINFE